MKTWVRAVGMWIEHRLGLVENVKPILEHPVPKGVNWWYVFGSATMTCLIIQILTGICLAMVYVPSADRAYESLEYLNYNYTLGWFLRALHYYGSAAMVVMMFAHMTQVFLYGAYKFPRELTWIVGVFLMFSTLGMAFTGQILRWDGDAYWGIGVMASSASRTPVVGPQMVELILNGEIIDGPTLTRFFSLHVFIIPAGLLILLTLHLHLVLRKGINEPPVPGKPVDPKTYEEEYHKDLKATGEPFFPVSVYKDAIFSALVVVVVVLLAAILGPYGPGEPPDPTLTDAHPRPDWCFLPLFALMSLAPAEAEDILILGLPVIIMVALLGLPFVDRKGEKASSRRPFAVVIVVLIYLSMFTLGWIGYNAPWSPHMHAWSGEPIPIEAVKDRSPLELQGAVILQSKQCRNCHAIDGSGGKRGPDLMGVGARLNREELKRQVIQGGGDMPSYVDKLKPAEVEALTAYLATLKPKHQSKAVVPTK